MSRKPTATKKPPRPKSEPERPERRPAPSWLGDLAIMLGTFAVVSAIAGLLGAANLGTALSFGQIGFAIAVVYVIARR